MLRRYPDRACAPARGQPTDSGRTRGRPGGQAVGMSRAAEEVVCLVRDPEADQRTVRLAAALAAHLDVGLLAVGARAPLPLPLPPAPALEGPEPMYPAAVLLPDAPTTVIDPRAVLDAIPPRIAARTEDLTSEPADALRQLSGRAGTRLIVCSDEGGGALLAGTRGNVGREVLGETRCPLVLVPAKADGRLANPPRLLCGVDDDWEARVIVQGAADLAEDLGAELDVVRVLERGAGLLQLLTPDARPGDVAAETVLALGRASGALQELADERRVDLFVVGPPGRGLLGSAILGSVVHDLLDQGTRPVAVLATGLASAVRRSRAAGNVPFARDHTRRRPAPTPLHGSRPGRARRRRR
jgi:nucleotide-binding universal stress UspA family protein